MYYTLTNENEGNVSWVAHYLPIYCLWSSQLNGRSGKPHRNKYLTSSTINYRKLIIIIFLKGELHPGAVGDAEHVGSTAQAAALSSGCTTPEPLTSDSPQPLKSIVQNLRQWEGASSPGCQPCPTLPLRSLSNTCSAEESRFSAVVLGGSSTTHHHVSSMT